EQFPFWSISTIRRSVASLEKQKLLIVGNYNKAGFDKTKWYSIDYHELDRVSRRCVQNEQTVCSNWTDGVVQSEQTNTIEYPKSNNIEDIVEIVTYLNDAADKRYKHTTSKTKTLINARLNENFTVDDFKTVIDK